MKGSKLNGKINGGRKNKDEGKRQAIHFSS
jgi:hypothetical protein